MYCSKCGSKNDDNAWKCVQCGQDLRKTQPIQPTLVIPNYLAQAILVTIFCCLPFGIPAIVFAAQVNGKIASGDLEGAKMASKNAKIWCWVAFGVGVALFIPYILLVLLGILAAPFAI